MQIISNLIPTKEILRTMRLRGERGYILEVNIKEDIRGSYSSLPREAKFRYFLSKKEFDSEWFGEVFLTSTTLCEDPMEPIAAKKQNPYARSGLIHMTQSDKWLCEYKCNTLFPETIDYAHAQCYCPMSIFRDFTTLGIPKALIEWKLSAIHDDNAVRCSCGMWMSRDKPTCGECNPCSLSTNATRVHYLGGHPHCHTEHGESCDDWYKIDDNEWV